MTIERQRLVAWLCPRCDYITTQIVKDGDPWPDCTICKLPLLRDYLP